MAISILIPLTTTCVDVVGTRLRFISLVCFGCRTNIQLEDETDILPSNFSFDNGNLTGAARNEKLTNLTASSIVYLFVSLPGFTDAGALALWRFFLAVDMF